MFSFLYVVFIITGIAMTVMAKSAETANLSSKHRNDAAGKPWTNANTPTTWLADQYIAKLNRYTTLAAEQMHAEGRTTSLWQALVRSQAASWRMYVLRGGIFDGWIGAVLCWSSGFSVLAKYTKLWRLGRP